MSVRRFSTTAALITAALSGCVYDGDNAADHQSGDGTFGDDFETEDAGAAPADGGAGAEDTGSPGSSVRLRVMQGVLNLRMSYLCHDPDFALDDVGAGPEPATQLPISSADGGMELGVTGYVDVPSMKSGAITVHRLQSSEPRAPDAASADAGAAGAGDMDGGAQDEAGDAALEEPTPRCDHASLEAVLPLPTPTSWIDPPGVELDAGARADASGMPEAGPSIETRGFASTASGNEPLTLFGSGLLIDRTELERRVEEERRRYREEHPDADEASVVEAADRYRRILDAAHGPRFLLSRAHPPRGAGSFSLHFSHLIPDVPGAETKPDSGSGALHLCITIGRMEGSELGDAGGAGFDFRSYAALGDDLDPALPYRFRVFVQSAYAQEQKTCATTSLPPVAELMIDAGEFEAGRSYSLIAWGALAPEAICTSYMQGSLITPGCAQSVDKLRAHLELIEN